MAALAEEEAGKGGDLVVLAVMPPGLPAQAPVGRMLEWHQLKLVRGLLISALPPGAVAEQLPAMPLNQVAGILRDAQVLAQGRGPAQPTAACTPTSTAAAGRLPSDVTEANVAAQLGRARLAVSSAAGCGAGNPPDSTHAESITAIR